MNGHSRFRPDAGFLFDTGLYEKTSRALLGHLLPKFLTYLTAINQHTPYVLNDRAIDLLCHAILLRRAHLVNDAIVKQERG